MKIRGTSFPPVATAILAGVLLTNGVSGMVNAEPPSDPMSKPLRLIPYANDDFGFRAMVPNGWTEVDSGVLRPGAGRSPSLTMAFFPGIARSDLRWWLEATVPGTTGFGERVGELSSPIFTWELYRQHLVNRDRMSVDLAIADAEGGSFIIFVVASGGDADALRSGLFIPVVKSVVPDRDAATDTSARADRSLFSPASTARLSLRTANRVDRGEYAEHTLSFASPKGGRVPATLLIPHGEGTFPGMILMHGQSLSRQHWLPWGRLYARAGAVVLLIDGPQHRPEPDGRPVVSFTPEDRDVQVQLIQDLRRGLDLLASHPKVDADRLVYVGYSYGGSMGGLLAGVDHRLAAAALMVGDGGFVEHLTGFDDRRETDMFFNLPVDAQAAWTAAMKPVEPLHFVGSATPTDLLFQAALLDTMVPSSDAVRYQRAGSEPKTILWYRSGHILPREAWWDQARWFERRIGIDASGFAVSAGDGSSAVSSDPS
jgi:dienelactone hydrolase